MAVRCRQHDPGPPVVSQFQTPRLPEDWRHLMGVTGNGTRPRVVLMLAAFEPRKRHIPFLRAFYRLAQRHPDLKLLLAGAGPEEARVRAEVAALGLGDQVVFCGHRPDPEALLALADVSVLTSDREGLPRVVIQSLAAGCPVVVNDLPGLDEVVTDGLNGMVLRPDDIDGIVARLDTLLRSDLALHRLRAGALRTDVSAWSLDRLGAQTTALYGLPIRTPRVAIAA